MLNALRESAKGIVAKCILLLLVGSFVFWGIGDIFTHSGGNNTVAKVGDHAISLQEYHQAVLRKQDEWRQKLGKDYNPELIKRLGLEQQVLYNMVNHVLFEQMAKTLGIEVSDTALRNEISKMSVFQDESGNFNKAQYSAVLQRNGLGEQRFLSDLRKDVSTRLVTDTFLSPPTIPAEWVNAVYHAEQEQRVVNVQIISASATPPAASDKEIEAWYKEHQDAFQTTPYRTISYIVISAADVAAHTEVPDEEIKQVYEERKAEFTHPEQRVVEQMLFEHEDDAKAAATKLASGQHFMDVAKASQLLNKETVSLGKVTKADLPTEITDSVFALKKDGVTAPIQSAFGWHVVHVTDIIPESVTTLEQARGDIVKELAAKESGDVMGKLVTTLEDTLASGATFTVAAEKIGQKVVTLPPVSQMGQLQNGKKATPPSYDNFLATAFATGEHEISKTQLDDGSYMVLHVDSVIPQAVEPLADVKQKIAADIVSNKKRMAVKSEAEDIAKELQAGKTPAADIFAKHHVTNQPSSVILTRTTDVIAKGALASTALPPELVQEVFIIKRHESTHAYPLQNGNYMIATVSDVVPAAPLVLTNDADKKTYKSVEQTLQKNVQDEMMHYMLTQAKTTFKISVNQALLSTPSEESGQ